MKTLNYILVLFFLSSCSSAQNFRLVNATHSVSIGGVKGARAEKFDITIKNNPKLEVKYLLVGNVIIELRKEIINGRLHLKGQYFPERPATTTVNGEKETLITRDDFNLKEVYLISENVKDKKEISQKINFSTKSKIGESLPTDDVPE